MRLQDKNFDINKNIYNIQVGQIFNKEHYLSTLTTKIEEVRDRIRNLENEEEGGLANKSIQVEITDNRGEKYALEFILKESVETALERSVTTMMDWASEQETAPWNHYFMYVSLNRAVWDIKDGKISPWLILNCKTGKDMLSKLNDEQLEMVFHVINPEHWALRFKRSKSDVELAKQVAKESSL